MTRLWRIGEGTPRPLSPYRLDSEDRLESWLAADIGLLDPELLVIGRQITTPVGRLDLLAIDADGLLTVIELKRDRTPRDVVAQVLDYGSWAVRLDTRAVYELADDYLQKQGTNLTQAFRRKFDASPPEPLNASHTLLIIASRLDPSSRRIVQYLSQVHRVGINTAFFSIFTDGDKQILSADWLMDQEVVVERTEQRVRTPWTGFKYVNAGEGEHRSWSDMRRYGFVAAGGGPRWSRQLIDRLTPDDQIFVYQKGAGYVGFGRVTQAAIMARDFTVDGKPLLDLELEQPALGHDCDDPDLAEYVVGVAWHRTFDVQQAKTCADIFSNQHVVCRLNDAATLGFLQQEFA